MLPEPSHSTSSPSGVLTPYQPFARRLTSEPETVERQQIKVLIRDKFTGLYQVSAKRWTQRASEAHDFRQGLHALRSAADEGLTNVEIVYDFDGMRESIVVPAMNVCSAK